MFMVRTLCKYMLYVQWEIRLIDLDLGGFFGNKGDVGTIGTF